MAAETNDKAPAAPAADTVPAATAEQQAEEAQVSLDERSTAEAHAAARAMWGKSYDENLSRAKGYVSKLPAKVQEVIHGEGLERFRSGMPVANAPAVLAWLADPARRASDLQGISAKSIEEAVEQRITKLEANAKWERNEGKDRELRQLYAIRAAYNVARL